MEHSAMSTISSQHATPVDWDKLLPPSVGIFWRHRWKEYVQNYGFPFSRGYIQNLDSQGEGPPHVLQFGRVAYTREELVGWLNTRQAMHPKGNLCRTPGKSV
ncbi:hypothetical protein NNJEOMEG_01138 [Fundidesulfovibrio magnetotacticus]|uniref:Uncharacterized protein n=1 Tax=Fundidesulfovibrio magnetotacticus TaxID=2730080 RepID=A0A6V8LUI2_9BACT|nr:hypothetical protein [Fundidesulfovibrio magnetotacticus]GFK93307.1 hypothetical protein NNJEOMEG_01138 [Fundidesulfovibrio magnetotacticus]